MEEVLIPIFRPKRRKTHTFWGGTYLYGLQKGVPPEAESVKISLSHNSKLLSMGKVNNPF